MLFKPTPEMGPTVQKREWRYQVKANSTCKGPEAGKSPARPGTKERSRVMEAGGGAR